MTTEELGKNLPINLIFLFEGEEEIGSPHFEEGVKKIAKKINPDIILITDMGLLRKGVPKITYGLRGITSFEIKVSGSKKDLHSGVFGGIVDNPALILCQLLAKIKDKNNHITIPNFYDDIQKPTPEEIEILESGINSEEIKMKTAGVRKFIAEKGFSVALTNKIRPSFDILGFYSGYTGPGVKTIIPKEASTKISFRIVPNQNPKKIETLLNKFIVQNAPKTVNVSVKPLSLCQPFLSDYKNHFVQKISRALEKTYKTKTAFGRSGASIGAAEVLARIFKKSTILTGFMPENANIHSPNENFPIKDFLLGKEALKNIYSSLAI